MRSVTATTVDRIAQVLADHEYVPIHRDPDAWHCACGVFWGIYDWRPDDHRAHVAAAVAESLGATA